MQMKTKEQLLKHYARINIPNSFIQYDVSCFEKGAIDHALKPDPEGYATNYSSTQELMSGMADVRVLIRPGVEKERVVKSLDRIMNWISSDRGYEQHANEVAENEMKYRKLHKDLMRLQQVLAENNMNILDAKAALNFGVEEPEPEDSIFNSL